MKNYMGTKVKLEPEFRLGDELLPPVSILMAETGRPFRTYNSPEEAEFIFSQLPDWVETNDNGE